MGGDGGGGLCGLGSHPVGSVFPRFSFSCFSINLNFRFLAFSFSLSSFPPSSSLAFLPLSFLPSFLLSLSYSDIFLSFFDQFLSLLMNFFLLFLVVFVFVFLFLFLFFFSCLLPRLSSGIRRLRWGMAPSICFSDIWVFLVGGEGESGRGDVAFMRQLAPSACDALRPLSRRRKRSPNPINILDAKDPDYGPD